MTAGEWRKGPSFNVNGVEMPTVQNNCGNGVAYVANPDDISVICAAPDLLDALEALLNECTVWTYDQPKQCEPDIESGNFNDAWNKARAIISRATGN